MVNPEEVTIWFMIRLWKKKRQRQALRLSSELYAIVVVEFAAVFTSHTDTLPPVYLIATCRNAVLISEDVLNQYSNEHRICRGAYHTHA